jgi:hypothetical protein
MLRSHESVRTAVARRVEPGLAYWSPSALSAPRSVFASWEPGSAQLDRVAQNQAWLQSRAAEAERRAREEAAALHLLLDAHAVEGLELVERERAQPMGQQLVSAGLGSKGWLAGGTERWRSGSETPGTARVAELLAVAAQVEEEEAVVAGGAAPPTPAALVLRPWSEGDRLGARWSDRQLELSPLRPRQQCVETQQHGVHGDSRPAAAPPAAAHVSVPVLLSQSSTASTASSMSEAGPLVDGGDGDDAGGGPQAARLSAPRASLVHRSDSSASFVNAPLDNTQEPSDKEFGPIPCPAPEPAMKSASGKALPFARPLDAAIQDPQSRAPMPPLVFPPSFVPQPSPEPREGETFGGAPVCPPHTAPPPPPPLEVHHTSRHLQAPPPSEVVRISSAGAQHQWRSEQSAEPGTPRPQSPRASLDAGQMTTRSFKKTAPPMDAPAEAPGEAEPAAPQPLPRGVPATMRRYIEACQNHGSTATPSGIAWSAPGFLYDADGDMRRCTVEWRSDRVAATDEGEKLLWSLPYAQIEALWWSAHSEEEDGDVLVCAVDSSRDGRLCVRQRDAMLGAVCKHWATVLRGWRLMAEPTSDDPRPHGGDAKAGGFQLVLAEAQSSSSGEDDDDDSD